jgi:hypothetical protein
LVEGMVRVGLATVNWPNVRRSGDSTHPLAGATSARLPLSAYRNERASPPRSPAHPPRRFSRS